MSDVVQASGELREVYKSLGGAVMAIKCNLEHLGNADCPKCGNDDFAQVDELAWYSYEAPRDRRFGNYLQLFGECTSVEFKLWLRSVSKEQVFSLPSTLKHRERWLYYNIDLQIDDDDERECLLEVKSGVADLKLRFGGLEGQGSGNASEWFRALVINIVIPYLAAEDDAFVAQAHKFLREIDSSNIERIRKFWSDQFDLYQEFGLDGYPTQLKVGIRFGFEEDSRPITGPIDLDPFFSTREGERQNRAPRARSWKNRHSK